MVSRILILLLCIMFQFSALAQGDKLREKNTHQMRSLESGILNSVGYINFVQTGEKKELFRTIQNGVASGEVESLSRHFGSNIYLNIRGTESGYFSANQAYYVLQNFFNQNKPVAFSFTSYGESGESPYATGRGSINVKGNREFIQVYVSLVKFKDRWVIEQFNIY
jgi:hypothetical protein